MQVAWGDLADSEEGRVILVEELAVEREVAREVEKAVEATVVVEEWEVERA